MARSTFCPSLHTFRKHHFTCTNLLTTHVCILGWVHVGTPQNGWIVPRIGGNLWICYFWNIYVMMGVNFWARCFLGYN